MSVKSRAGWLPLQSLAAASIGAAYVAIGTPSEQPITMVTITNNTDVLLTISTDGVEDHMVIPAYSWGVRDVSAMNIATSLDSTLHARYQFYAKGLPTTGLVYVEAMYIG